jgi:hypothetical protein
MTTWTPKDGPSVGALDRWLAELQELRSRTGIVANAISTETLPRAVIAARAAHDLYAEVERLRISLELEMAAKEVQARQFRRAVAIGERLQAELALARHHHKEACELLESRAAALAEARKDVKQLRAGIESELLKWAFTTGNGADYAETVRAVMGP